MLATNDGHCSSLLSNLYPRDAKPIQELVIQESPTNPDSKYLQNAESKWDSSKETASADEMFPMN